MLIRGRSVGTGLTLSRLPESRGTTRVLSKSELRNATVGETVDPFQ